MTAIKDIMHVGVGMPERQRFAQFSRDIIGLPTVESADGRVTYVRADRYRHRIAARTAAEPELIYIGLDVGGPEELDRWKNTLTG